VIPAIAVPTPITIQGHWPETAFEEKNSNPGPRWLKGPYRDFDQVKSAGAEGDFATAITGDGFHRARTTATYGLITKRILS
jgi:hypothetical protein